MAPASPLKVGLLVARIHQSWEQDTLVECIFHLWQRLSAKFQETGLISEENAIKSNLTTSDQHLLLKQAFVSQPRTSSSPHPLTNQPQASTALTFIGRHPSSHQSAYGVWIKPHHANPHKWRVELQLVSPTKSVQRESVADKAGKTVFLSAFHPRRAHEPGWYCPILDEYVSPSAKECAELAELSGLTQIELGGIVNSMNVRARNNDVKRVAVTKKRKFVSETEELGGKAGRAGAGRVVERERVVRECHPRVKRRRFVRGCRVGGAGTGSGEEAMGIKG
ncbi:uncharacterized protein K452DRAFT_342041 [Aplosporella prunicola CBS 121167]|uniref:Uncharacterized protein n=1 Tax=Aplosporella prunicola CBS 121167 TaxID=1176127 RepID=A0A6A6AWM4_9PEZI|nr:uncharacterized protein K452DRAFT_344984 [Aplosporella prunicola CBS 121167]XP_033392513.1 uncharacterized protein K452DRAFT_342041 [Aplosporella prunicola CBS 121167]KAF2136130.1 hypothetical protein K452DRAFT_344984 [Aplosporella prunicola CBS 121167]KAF2136795.1 hypothetical protein K452DRAFT_342041 [Aplosporella prunicola CBS 121167]